MYFISLGVFGPIIDNKFIEYGVRPRNIKSKTKKNLDRDGEDISIYSIIRFDFIHIFFITTKTTTAPIQVKANS